MTKHFEISRRHFMAGLSTLIGTAAANSLLAGDAMAVALNYKSSSDDQTRKIFNQQQMQLLQQVCSVIIPATDTPSAGQLGVHGFIDHQLFHCFSKVQQDMAVEVLANIAQQNFLASTPTQQYTSLEALDQGTSPFNAELQSQFKFLKYLICFGYYTSQLGASEELRYRPIPGGFKGSIPLGKDDAAWGSYGLFFGVGN